MTNEEAFDVFMNDIQVDCAWTTNFDRDYECLMKCKDALEKQIPKMAVRTNRSSRSADCPACDRHLPIQHFDCCPHCGQRIKWWF